MKIIITILLIIIAGLLIEINIKINETKELERYYQRIDEEFWKLRMEAIQNMNWDNLTNYE